MEFKKQGNMVKLEGLSENQVKILKEDIWNEGSIFGFKQINVKGNTALIEFDDEESAQDYIDYLEA